MSELPKRLRATLLRKADGSLSGGVTFMPASLIEDAADRIEALEAVLKPLADIVYMDKTFGSTFDDPNIPDDRVVHVQIPTPLPNSPQQTLTISGGLTVGHLRRAAALLAGGQS